MSRCLLLGVLVLLVAYTQCDTTTGPYMAIINDILFQSLNTVRNQTMILKQRVDEKMAILQIDTNKDSWGHALLRIKNFLNEEIGAIYLEVFGINLNDFNLDKTSQKHLTLILVGVSLVLSTILLRVFSLQAVFTMALAMVSIKSLYGTAASIQAALWVCGVLLLALNYALTYPIQCLMLLLTWQLAKYIVWICTPAPVSHRDVSTLENRVRSLEQRLERTEHHVRVLRAGE